MISDNKHSHCTSPRSTSSSVPTVCSTIETRRDPARQGETESRRSRRATGSECTQTLCGTRSGSPEEESCWMEAVERLTSKH